MLFGSNRWKGRVDADGLLTVAIPADESFLGWAVNKNATESNSMRINAIVLVEFIYDIFRFAAEQLVARATNQAWRARICARRMKSAGILMKPGAPSRFGWESGKRATTDEYESRSYTVEGRPEADGYQTMLLIYALFGLGSEAVPFSKNGAIDPLAIGAPQSD